MKLFIIELNNVTISSPSAPHECLFLDISSDNQNKTKLSPELFQNSDLGTQTLTKLIETHNFSKHNTPSFQNESFIDLENGFKLCIGEDYVRFVDSYLLEECESMYWHVQEFVEDFTSVIGAIIGFILSKNKL